MSTLSAPSRKTCRHLWVAGCLMLGFAALPLRADEEPKAPAGIPAPPRPAGGEGSRPEPGQALKAARERLDQLNLTDDQKKKIDEIYKDAADELKNADKGDRQAMGKIMRDLREKVGGVLTEEQKTKLQQMRGGPGGGPGSPIDRLQGALDKADLSDDQKAKLKPVLEEARKKFTELRGQVQNGDREAMREKFKATMDDLRDKLKEILTPEQADKVKAAMEAGGPRPGGGPGGPARPGAEPPPKPADK